MTTVVDDEGAHTAAGLGLLLRFEDDLRLGLLERPVLFFSSPEPASLPASVAGRDLSCLNLQLSPKGHFSPREK